MIGCAFVLEFPKHTQIDTHQKTRFKPAHTHTKQKHLINRVFVGIS